MVQTPFNPIQMVNVEAYSEDGGETPWTHDDHDQHHFDYDEDEDPDEDFRLLNKTTNRIERDSGNLFFIIVKRSKYWVPKCLNNIIFQKSISIFIIWYLINNKLLLLLLFFKCRSLFIFSYRPDFKQQENKKKFIIINHPPSENHLLKQLLHSKRI